MNMPRTHERFKKSAAEFRQILLTLYGGNEATTDWELAGMAAEDYGLTQSSINRYLTGEFHPSGPTARLTEKLLAEHNARKDFDSVVQQIAMVFANRIMSDFGIRTEQADNPADAVAKIIAGHKAKTGSKP